MMDPSRAEEQILRSSSAVSLHQRFSEVMMQQLTWPRAVTFDPIQLQLRAESAPQTVVLLLTQEASPVGPQQAPHLQREAWHPRRRRSVWTRLGGPQVRRPPATPPRRGFWSFMNKYRWRARITSINKRRGHLRRRFRQRHFLRRASVRTKRAGRRLDVLRGGASAVRGRGLRRDNVPTKRQLDAELDEYMSLSKSNLDRQLDDYMSMSRSQLDAQLEEYMSMAGDTLPQWD